MGACLLVWCWTARSIAYKRYPAGRLRARCGVTTNKASQLRSLPLLHRPGLLFGHLKPTSRISDVEICECSFFMDLVEEGDCNP
jgi:hypothetical protein